MAEHKEYIKLIMEILERTNNVTLTRCAYYFVRSMCGGGKKL